MNIHADTMVETSVPERDEYNDRANRGREGCVRGVRETESRLCREFASAVLMAVDDGQRSCMCIQNTLFRRLLPVPQNLIGRLTIKIFRCP